MSEVKEKCPNCENIVYGDIPTMDKVKEIGKGFLSGLIGGIMSNRYDDDDDNSVGEAATYTTYGVLSSFDKKQMFEFHCPHCGYAWKSYGDGIPIQSLVNSTATIEKIWTEFNVYNDGVKGLNIHIKFIANWLREIECRVSAYFYYENGNALKDVNNTCCTTDGHVAVGKNFKPPYDHTRWDDFIIFMPYDELHVNKSCDLSFQIIIRDDNKDSLYESNYYSFSIKF